MHPKWVGVRTASPPRITPLMSLVPLGCADVANLFLHDDTEAGLSGPGSQYLTHPPWTSSWKGNTAALRGDRLPPIPAPAGRSRIRLELEQQHQGASTCYFFPHSNFFLAPFHAVIPAIPLGENHDSFGHLRPRWQPRQGAGFEDEYRSLTGKLLLPVESS